MEFLEKWLLPDGIEESLPREAAWLELQRRKIIDLYAGWGYELVIPPLIEYLESLLVGPSDDLDLQTFKITDQLTGRLMGIRADMTPQVARIDAHVLKRAEPVRLCYLGTVLRTRPTGKDGTRCPLQVGAELYGHAGIDSDVEIIALMLDTLYLIDVAPTILELGHVGVYSTLAHAANLNREQEQMLSELLRKKATPDMVQALQQWKISESWQQDLLKLVSLNGEEQILNNAYEMFGTRFPEIAQCIKYLQSITGQIQKQYPKLQIRIDFAELTGYHYQNGVVFAVYVEGEGQEVARGGRYDEIGRVYGRSRPATGFSTDLKLLAKLTRGAVKAPSAIFAPYSDDANRTLAIRELRKRGERVVAELRGQQVKPGILNCDRQLVNEKGKWIVKDFK